MFYTCFNERINIIRKSLKLFNRYTRTVHVITHFMLMSLFINGCFEWLGYWLVKSERKWCERNSTHTWVKCSNPLKYLYVIWQACCHSETRKKAYDHNFDSKKIFCQEFQIFRWKKHLCKKGDTLFCK